MAIGDLSPLEITYGITTLTLVVLSIIIGIRMITKYFSSKHFEHITLGLSWIFLSSAWWGSSFSFLSVLITGDPLPDLVFIILGNCFLPLAVISWIYSFSTILVPEKKKILMMIFVTICILYEIYLIISLMVNPTAIAIIYTISDSSPGLIPMIFMAFSLLTTTVTGIIFSLQSIKVDKPKTNLRGKILLLGFILLATGSILDIFLPQNAFSLIITRLILAFSAIGYYLGFFIPDKLADRLLKS